MLTDNISEMENKMMLALAKEGPMSGYDFHLAGKRERGSRKALMSSGKWEKAKKHLGPEGLNYICPATLVGRPKDKDAGRRRRTLFWLTDKGIIYALLNGVDTNSLLAKTKEVYPNNEEKALIIEMSNSFPKPILEAILSSEQKIDVPQITALIMAFDFQDFQLRF